MLDYFAYNFLVISVATYNGLELHGKPIGVSWTTLATTAEAGSSTIEVTDDVSLWESVVTDRDIEIIITTTSNRVTDTERAVITSASGTTITLKAPLERRHLGKFTVWFADNHYKWCIATVAQYLILYSLLILSLISNTYILLCSNSC